MSEVVAIRCYTGARVGAGHLMRCRELARQLKARGCGTIIVGPPEAMRDEQDSGLFDVWHEASAEFEALSDARAFTDLCAESDVRYAIMDDYRISPDYQHILEAAGLRWLQQFDSSRPWSFWADILVNAGPHEQAANYAPFLKNPKTQILFGPEFAVLRPEFTAVRPQPNRRDVRSLFLSFGGGDDAGLIMKSVDALRPLLGENFRLVIASGRSNPGNVGYVREFSEEFYIDFCIAPPDMATLMCNCDLALLAGGTMSYEAAICGLPLILVSVADNQERACKGWQERIGAIYLGRADALSQPTIRDTVMGLIADGEAREEMASLGRAAVDGRGATRLIDALLDG